MRTELFQIIEPEPAIALLEHHGWEDQQFRYEDDKGKNDRRVIPMTPPEGDDAAVLFIGRDRNKSRDYLYGIPLQHLEEVDYVVLWAEGEREAFLLPADFLRDLRSDLGRGAYIDERDRWHVNIYFEWLGRLDGCAIVPRGAPDFGRNIDEYCRKCPGNSVRDWFESLIPSDPNP